MTVKRRAAMFGLLMVLLAIPCANGAMWSIARSAGWLGDGPRKDASHAAIVVDRQSYDLGEVTPGRVLEAPFQVTNVGAQRLVLRALESSCECISANRSELLVGPGATQKLVARLDTTHLKGPMRLELHYRTNDPSRPRLMLLVLADVRQP